jgi:hypothetical protein
MHSSHRRTSSAPWFSLCAAILVAAVGVPRLWAGQEVPHSDSRGSNSAANSTVPAPSGRQNEDLATATVLEPDGVPARKAQIAVAVVGSTVWVKNGELFWSKKAARCDADDLGRFHFALPPDDFSLVITHPSGFLRLNCSRNSNPVTIKLVPWARVEGTLRVAGKLRPGARVDIALNEFGPRDPQLFFTNFVTTDKNASFVFKRVVPGRGRVFTALMQSATKDRVLRSSKSISARFFAGKTTRVDLGQSGRPVIGQLRSPPGARGPFDRARVIVDPAEPRNDVRQIVATVDGNGNFCLDDVPVGKYRLVALRVQGDDAALELVRQFIVPAIDEKLSQRPVDLGVLTLNPPGAR